MSLHAYFYARCTFTVPRHNLANNIKKRQQPLKLKIVPGLRKLLHILVAGTPRNAQLHFWEILRVSMSPLWHRHHNACNEHCPTVVPLWHQWSCAAENRMLLMQCLKTKLYILHASNTIEPQDNKPCLNARTFFCLFFFSEGTAFCLNEAK